MKKPEPLKDKGLMKKSLILSYWEDGDTLYPEEDIKLAVKWLREHLLHRIDEDKSIWSKAYIENTIDIAFQDIIKK